MIKNQSNMFPIKNVIKFTGLVRRRSKKMKGL